MACNPVFGEDFLGFLTQFEPLSTFKIDIGIDIPLDSQRILILPFLPLSLLPIRVFFCKDVFYESLLNLLQYCLFYIIVFSAGRHVDLSSPNQGSNLHPLHWNAKS